MGNTGKELELEKNGDFGVNKEFRMFLRLQRKYKHWIYGSETPESQG